ncbi:MAG: type III pantothenate kinase, partial [Phycisphaeraceae bacterium]|nr:type III pantothenate kinase [Phycisphaeraceae bacterium]
MNVNLLAINVGNTHTRFGAFIDGNLEDTRSFTNDRPARLVDEAKEAFEKVAGRDRTAILMGSTNPPVADQLAKRLNGQLDTPVYRVDQDVTIPIGRQLDPEAIVGEDRLLNAAAAFATLEQACVIVDAGTAITIDFVDGAGTFHGGAIAPGAEMMLSSMHKQTAQLPEIDFAAPEEAVGHNTAEAMRSGVFHGLRGMVRELTEQIAEMAGAYPVVIATGGD